MELEAVHTMLGHLPIFYMAILARFIAGASMGLGVLPVLFTINISEKLQAAMLGFGVGVMLAATSFSLIEPYSQ